MHRRSFARILVLACVVLAPLTSPSSFAAAPRHPKSAAAAPAELARGYHARACGFDLNHNGIFGEAADCNICNGTTTDPGGASPPPNMIYVSCDTGADNTSCGSPENPCGSINYAWNNRTGPP
ncbi:MAG: hypothetical protein JOZ15_00445, partial [Acidobacteria bacterium]|nr:hypothetical protein [Acidobacteriota bacterium]